MKSWVRADFKTDLKHEFWARFEVDNRLTNTDAFFCGHGVDVWLTGKFVLWTWTVLKTEIIRLVDHENKQNITILQSDEVAFIETWLTESQIHEDGWIFDNFRK